MDEFSKEAVLEATRNAPAPVQHALGSKKTADTMMAMQAKYSLHVDVVSLISRETGYLLLGLIDPATFLQRLQKKGLDARITKGVMEDINKEIFVPLQQRMRDYSPENADAFEEEDDWEVDVSEKTSTPLENTPQRTTLKAPLPVMSVGERQTISSPTFAAAHLEEPHVEERRTMPARSFQTASIPISQPPQIPTPVPSQVLPPTPEPAPQAAAAPSPTPISVPVFQQPSMSIAPAPVRLTPVDRAPSAAPITKEYGSDPYREPIE